MWLWDLVFLCGASGPGNPCYWVQARLLNFALSSFALHFKVLCESKAMVPNQLGTKLFINCHFNFGKWLCNFQSQLKWPIILEMNYTHLELFLHYFSILVHCDKENSGTDFPDGRGRQQNDMHIILSWLRPYFLTNLNISITFCGLCFLAL